MSSAQPSPLAPEEISRDATWLVQALDPAAMVVRLIAMSEESYRTASFLDDRMLQQLAKAHIVPWAAVANAVPDDARKDARWIFHIGHVGSTLVARLLGELPGVLSIREPRFLRDLTTVTPDRRHEMATTAQSLFSRTFEAREIALVKATSFVSEIAPELVPAGERALFMYASPRNYIASILAGENSVQELRMLAPIRARRLSHRVSALGPAHNEAQLAAVAWACEMTSLEAAAGAMEDRRIEWADFDMALPQMKSELARLADFFGFSAQEGQLQSIASGPLMGRYSKDTSYDYSADLRRDLIAEAEGHFRGDIDGALAMLRTAAEKSPLLARALARATER